MSQQHIHLLLKPQSVAVIGASNNTNRAGYVVMRNLLEGGFSGPVMPVTPKYKAVGGVLAYADIESLPCVPDLAIICTAARRVPEVVAQLGSKGVATAIVLASGLSNREMSEGCSISEAMLEAGAQHNIRILGPNSLGLIIPNLGLNASFSPTPALPGKIALLSQSSAICTTLLDWARPKGIGFSTVISLGDGSDICFAELIDYLSRDVATKAIILCIDSISNPRRFMSAARAASRAKPILVFKSGSTPEGALATQRHSGGINGSDAVYDAAISRAGMLRVKGLHELFASVEALAHPMPLNSERLCIISNGGGPAVMAVDALIERKGKLAELNEQTLAQLSTVLPPYWDAANPIDILGDATPKRYAEVFALALEDSAFDNILVMHAPTAAAPAVEYAQAIIDVFKSHKRRKKVALLSNWSGDETAIPARKLFAKAGIPTFRTPTGAIEAFMHRVEYQRNQKLLMETPESVLETQDSGPAARTDSQAYIRQALNDQHTQLETHDAQRLLQNYRIDCIPTHLVHNADEAVERSEALGYPVAVKLISGSIEHKSKMGGVALNNYSADEVRHSTSTILQRVKEQFSDLPLEGIAVQAMAQSSGAQEFRIAVLCDEVFGPVILLGDGGADWNPSEDAAVALPPLNMALARYMVINALAEKKIKDRKLLHPVNWNKLYELLCKVSQLITDHPQIQTLDINPALAADDKITVLDASISLAEADEHLSRFAISPYPKELEEEFTLKDGREVLLRPIRPEDEHQHRAFDDQLSREDRYKRFFGEIGELNHEDLARLTQIDYEREMAFIIVPKNGPSETLGVVRVHTDPDNTEAEFAVVVRSDLKGLGLGRMLMEKVVRYCRGRKTLRICGVTLPENRGMIDLSKKLGFKVKYMMEDGEVSMELALEDI